MLSHLSIQNYTIAEHLELELHSGMTVITGETGAGKSISMDALGLALGDRADSKAVQHGADRANIHATFDIKTLPLAQRWLKDHELDCAEECILRRVITKEGRSRAYINGQPATLQDLKTLGNMLIDIHGQHEHQSLLKKTTHREMLDAFAKHKPLAQEVATLYQTWSDTQSRLEQLMKNTQESQARAQLVAYQAEELDLLSLQADELESLEAEQKSLANAEHIIAASQQAIDLCEGDNGSGVLGLLNQLRQLLVEFKESNHSLCEAGKLFESAHIHADEGRQFLQQHIDGFEANPARLAQVEERLSSIYDISRKHKVEPAKLVDVHQQLLEELEELSGGGEKIEALQAQLEDISRRYETQANKLSKQRRKAANTLTKAVTTTLKTLDMANCLFEIQLTTTDNGTKKLHPNGNESVEYLIASNKGQPPQPLAKIASGGELSRISLAIQVVTAKTSDTPTLVFDEVDVGIGGSTAEVVGQLLRQLSAPGQVQGQVICVTHQPQVAAKGHQHLRVSKHVVDDKTVTEVSALSGESKIDEIARMLGGINVTKKTIDHAKEMLALEEV